MESNMAQTIYMAKRTDDPVKKYMVYLVYDEFPIFVYATEYELNETAGFYVFIYNGNYTISFPIHHVKEIKMEARENEEEE